MLYLISAKYLIQKSIDAQTKVELKIPQLTHAKIAQIGRHVSANTKVLSIVASNCNPNVPYLNS